MLTTSVTNYTHISDTPRPRYCSIIFYLFNESFQSRVARSSVLRRWKVSAKIIGVEVKRLSAVLLVTFLNLVVSGQTGARPNILFIFADDQRADTIGAHGNRAIQTPNIDRLVRSGFSFRQNHVFGSNNGAVCVPSRAMLMTGQTWFKIDTLKLQDELLLPQLLVGQGYETFATGKWHNGEESWRRAFQRGKAVMFGGMSDHTKVPVKDLHPDGRLSTERTGEKFSSELFADAAIEYLEQRDRGRPFFAYVAFTAPHDPRQPTDRWREYYERRLPPAPVNFLPVHPFDNGMVRNLRDENLAAWPREERVIREQLAEYYGLLSHMDEQLGRILTALKRTGQDRNTIIIYAADNGLALGSHGLLGKQSVYQHSVRVPLIISGPGIPRGGSSEALTYLFDIFPTVCQLVGIAPPKGLAGQSLVPLVRGERASIRETVFLPFQKIQRAIRDERWKLIAYPQIGYLQLFDLQRDPHEMVDLYDRPGMRRHVERLMAQMKEWQERVGDTLAIPTARRLPAPLDLSGEERKPDQWQPDWIVRKYFGREQ
jgi:arylsulfatase A-like enzyme